MGHGVPGQGGEADDLAGAVDCKGAALGAAQGAQVGHGAVAPREGMDGSAGGEAVADGDAGIIERIDMSTHLAQVAEIGEIEEGVTGEDLGDCS